MIKPELCAKFTHYRGSRQDLVQARTLTHCPRKRKQGQVHDVFAPAPLPVNYFTSSFTLAALPTRSLK